MLELFIFIALLVSLSSFLSLCEVAILSCNHLKLTLLTEQHPRLKSLSKRKSVIASTILIVNNVVDIVGVSYGSSMAYQLFGESIEYTIYTVCVTCSLLYLATLIPKLFAANHADSVLRYTGLIIIALYWILKPIIAIAYLPVNLFIKGGVEKGLSQSELNAVIGMAQNKNLLNDKQSTIINNIIGLEALKVSDILSSRSEIDRVDLECTVAECKDIIMTGHHKRYVVTKSYSSNSSEKAKLYPVGIVLYQDLVQTWLKDAQDTRVSSIMHPVMTTMESESAIDLLEKLNHSADHITVITNNNGAIKGVLQADDIISALLSKRCAIEPIAINNAA